LYERPPPNHAAGVAAHGPGLSTRDPQVTTSLCLAREESRAVLVLFLHSKTLSVLIKSPGRVTAKP
jgi:hypothetical protein